MRKAVWVALAVPALVTLMLPAACREDGPSCYAGDWRACTCSGGALGYQGCIADREEFGECVCDGRTPGLDGSFEANDAGADVATPSGKLPFMSKCSTNDECESGNCHTFSQQGSFCTKGCTDTIDCPAPSSGCNRRGICKAP